MYLDQSPATADYFEERASSIFVLDPLQSWIEVFAESGTGTSDNEDLAKCNSQVLLRTHVQNVEKDAYSATSEMEELTTGRQPDYIIEHGLRLQKTIHEADLRAFISVGC